MVAPSNFGFNGRAGTDALVHLVQFLLEENHERVLFSVDGVGAFDHVCRARFFEELRDTPALTDLLPFVGQWYGAPTQYRWFDAEGNVHDVTQGDGGEQGDALMPALFCLALRRALREIQEHLPPGALAVAYLDDIYVVCLRDHTHHCYTVVRDILERTCHIDVNLGKLAAWGAGVGEAPPRVTELGANVWRGNLPEHEQGLRVLGTPVGSETYILEACREVVNDEAQLLEQIPKLASLHAGWLILYFCVVPRINHLLRTLPPQNATAIAQHHDTGVTDLFRQLFGIPSEVQFDNGVHSTTYNTVIQQAVLPQRLAGCGLRSSERTAFAAFWASWADSLGVIRERFPTIGLRIQMALGELSGPLAATDGLPCLRAAEAAGRHCDESGWETRPSWDELANGLRAPQPQPEDSASLGEWPHGWQYHASNALEQAALASVKRDLALPSRRVNAQAVGKSRLESCMGRFAYSWLTACPGSMALTFSDEEIRCSMRRRLGVGVCIDGPDPHGHRRLAEGIGGRTQGRHTSMTCALRQVFIEAGGQIPDRNVERMLSTTHIPVPSGDTRRLDLIVSGLNVAQGRPLFCDVTVVWPITREGRSRPGTSNSGGTPLIQAERDNNSNYQPVIDSGLGALYCLSHEVYGRMGRQCVDLLPKLAREKARCVHPRLRRGTALAYLSRWTSLLGVALQKAVAASVLRSEGADLPTTLLEPAPNIADLPLA